MRGSLLMVTLIGLSGCTLALNGIGGDDAGPRRDASLDAAIVASDGGDAGPPCGPMTCAGCCDGTRCLPGDQPDACGTAGGACSSCAPMDDCTAGVCSGCNATTCPMGCCSGSVCEPPSAMHCGTDGARCVPCEPGGSCSPAGSCEPPPPCPFVRNAAGLCVSASNLGDSELSACDASAPPLTPAAGQDVVLTSRGIECEDDCGDGSTQLIPFVADSDPWRICVSSLNLPAGLVLEHDGTADRGLVLMVFGDATIDGEIDFDGEAGEDGDSLETAGGAGGPGGFDGADGPVNNNDDGMDGLGPGGGEGGERNSGVESSGGGGGGYGGMGGDGGDGRVGTPGGMGGAPYGDPVLVPLQGGSGGGSGGEGGGTGVFAGSAGGGGGGALQISVRGMLTLGSGGAIHALGGRGGAGQLANVAGGGGGSGGAVLLEADTLVIDGRISVEGGPGGSTPTGNGGAGASGTTIDGADGDFASGGGGGGGGGGRVRLNSVSGTACANVSPRGACTSSTL